MDSREEFEKRYPVPNGFYFDNARNDYWGGRNLGADIMVYRMRWETWQAARAKPIKLPPLETTGQSSDFLRGFLIAEQAARELYKRAIESAGYKCE